MQNDKNFIVESPSVRPSFDETLEDVKEQIDITCFPFELLMQAQEIAEIITEVMRLRPEDKLRVDGTLREAWDVQAVYAKLENEHVMHVLENYNEIPYKVNNPKKYLRTALYNAVFELHNADANLFSATGGDRV